MEKIRIWNSKTLSDNYSLLKQIQANIENLLEKVDALSLAELPNSMLPTNTLYEITYCYELMYSKLLEYDLLNTGNPKPVNTYH